MSSFTVVLIAGVAALSCLPGILLGLWFVHSYRRKVAEELDGLRQSIEECRNSCGEDVANLMREIRAREPDTPNNEAASYGGRLTRSARAQALQLLRAGIPAEAAAETSGLPRRDVRLLARVSRLLCQS